jgi:CDP-diacylglycerol--glycerol-3-phosphate 3-phosphatidyltransferase
MPTLYDLKPGFQQLLRPLVARCAAIGITPNQITVATTVVSVALGAALAMLHRGWILLPIFLFVRMALNAMDGMLAREYKLQSRIGVMLNELGDVLSDGALTLPIATLDGWNPLWVAGAIFFAAIAEMAGVLGVAVGGSRRNDGPFGKSDRAFALGFLGAWLAIGWPIAPPVRQIAPIVWIVLCFATVLQRARRALR